MKTLQNIFFVATAAAFVFTSAAMGQQSVIEQPVQQPMIQTQQGQAQAYVQPRVQPPYVQPIQQNPFYFGINVVLKKDGWGRTTLQIVSVTPGSPAAMAGLEYGDEIRRVNGRGFRTAMDSFDAVRMLNQYVSTPVYGGPAPASPGVAAMVIGPPMQPNPVAQMVVRNVRNGQNVSVTVYPTRNVSVGAPAAAAAAMTSAGG